MSTYKAGDLVAVLEPFAAAFPEHYQVEGLDGSGFALIAGGISFDDAYLTLIEAGPNGEPLIPAAPRHITAYAFRKRFTSAEQVALELASADDPSASSDQRTMAATLRVYAADLAAARFVDLDLQATIDGVNALGTFGLLAPGRAAQILFAPVQPDEAA